MLTEGKVGPGKGFDANQAVARLGSELQIMTAELHGKYAESMLRGKLFSGVSASTGIALIVPATTGGHPTLWNPQGSGVNLSIVRLILSYVSGANAPTAIEWARTANAGNQIGTGAPIVTFTDVAPVPALVGGSGSAKARWAPTANTFVAAPTFIKPSGLSLDTMAAASTNAPFSMIVDYDGIFGVAPGNAISLCSQAATTTALFQVEVYWEEIDITF